MTGKLAGPILAAIARRPRAWAPIAGWILVALLAALAARVFGAPSGADRVLRGAFGAIALPLLAFSVVSSFAHGSDLPEASRGLVAMGVSRSAFLWTTILCVLSVASCASAVSAVLVCIVAHGPTDAPLASDAIASFGVAFVAGGAYGTFFLFGSMTRRGVLRPVLLELDWVLGASQGFFACFTPRAHVASLLGGSSCLDFSRRQSSVLLVGLALLYLALAWGLGRRWARS